MNYQKAHDRAHKEVLEIMSDAMKLMETKGKDYGSDNFIKASEFASAHILHNIEPWESVVVMLGIKLARYDNLVKSGKPPEHESIKDTIRDMINYIAIMERERLKQEYIKNGQEEESSSVRKNKSGKLSSTSKRVQEGERTIQEVKTAQDTIEEDT